MVFYQKTNKKFIFNYYMENSYNNKKLKFPLSKKEMEKIDEVWDFIDIFRETALTRGKYNRQINK